jgi:hypothetical protein
MEKFPMDPIKKINKIRKVTSAAIHIAAMDASLSALKAEEHTTNINKKPELEITQVQQTPAEVRNPLDEQLKKSTQDYFKKENKETQE